MAVDLKIDDKYMVNIKEYIENEFFIIDSKDLHNIRSHLFGFSIYNGQIIFNDNLEQDMFLNGDGSYVRILKEDDTIQISQDFNGCYGIYVYKYEENFVISNSFLKLVEYLKDKYPFSLNLDVLHSFIPSDLCSIAYKQTMINEIQMIPRNYILNIHIPNNSLSYNMIDYKENEIPINSEEGIQILDEWFYKWVIMFRNLKLETNFLQVDLTGGFDSRIVFTLLLNSNINLNKILIRSINDSVHKEDFEIASTIADKYNFNLNNFFFKNLIKINDVTDSINLAYYVKLAFHKQFAFPSVISSNKIYIIGGFGGESLRKYWSITPNVFIDRCLYRAERYSPEFISPMKKVLNDAFKDLQNDFNITDENSKRLTELLYREVRNRNHFGKNAITYYMTNQIQLSPLLDPNLHKLQKDNDDENLLFALIFTRYCPSILEIPFDNGKSINKETINRANEINEKYPFKLKDLNYIDGPKNLQTEDNLINNSGNRISTDEYIKKVFLSNAFKKTFEIYYSEELYEKILLEANTLKFQPLSLVNTSLGVLKIIQAAKFNNEIFSKNPTMMLEDFINSESFLKNGK